MQLLPRHDTSSFTPAEKQELLVDPYEKAPLYTQTVIGVVGGVILIASVIKHWGRFKYTKAGKRIANSGLALRITAYTRYVGTKPGPGLRFPTRGIIFLLAVFWTFVLFWSLLTAPYYRSRWNVGSPPLAIRTGMMALGIFPFILAFASKFNIVTFVTGYSHEKLQVFHQWFSYLFLILSLLHTFPFVMAGREIRPNTDGKNPTHMTQIGYSWHIGKVYYWTGVAMLVPLLWLCFASLTPLRQRWYEIFKYTHILATVFFSAFFYLHCNKLLTSWDYLYATAGLYGFSVVMRFGLMFWRNGRGVPPADIQVLPENAVRLTIKTPHHKWKAGQHYFINFCKTRWLESHPYTISNACNSNPSEREMIVVLKTDIKGGIGARLRDLASAKTPVLLDGPYGAGADLTRHDTAILLAGGTGVSFIAGILQDLCQRYQSGQTCTRKIILHWVVRQEASLAWFTEQIQSSIAGMPREMVEIHLHVTSSDTETENMLASEEKHYEHGKISEDEDSDNGEINRWIIHRKKPCLPCVLRSSFVHPGSIGIASCGPTTFTHDVRKAVAAKQRNIAFGMDVRDVELHTEEFEW